MQTETAAPQPSRVAIGLVALVTIAAALVGSACATFLVDFGLCGGDGGDPYSARASTAGRFCASPASDVYVVVLLLAPPLVALVLGILALRRRAWRLVTIGAVAAFAVGVLMTVVPMSLPADCSAEQVADGADCATY